MTFENGDRVMTPDGEGIVVYKRYTHLNSTFQYVDVYSVKLISQLQREGYTGSIYKADVVTSINEA